MKSLRRQVYVEMVWYLAEHRRRVGYAGKAEKMREGAVTS